MKRYSEYKDSGVKWLGEIPNHWEMKRVGKICNFSKGLQITKADLVYDGVPVVSYGQVHAKYNTRTHLSSDMIRYVPESYKNNTSKVQIGEFIVADTSEDIEGCGNMAYNDCENNLYAGYHTIIIKNVKYDYPKYLAYFFNSLSWRSQIRSLVNGVKVYTINRTILKGTFTLLPTKQEQEAIVDYLDNVTSKIDIAITQQQKMIELLNERKQIIINNAVTKGLNPNVQMKDSGIEWIGEIPEHWGIMKLKHCSRTNSGSTPKVILGKDNPKSSIKWVRTTDLSNNIIYDTTEYLSSLEMKSASCPMLSKDTVLISMYGGAGSFGKLGILGLEATINQAICSISCNESVLPKFMFYYLQSIRPIWMKFAASTRKDPNLNQETIKNIHVVLPRTKEQEKIVDYIEQEIKKIDSIVYSTNKQIALLQERKQIITNDVVTGKVKVI